MLQLRHAGRRTACRRACAATSSCWTPARSCLPSARVRPRVAKSVRSSGRAIRITSVLRSPPAAPMLTSFTIQATLSPLTDQRAGKYPLGPAPPISRQSPIAMEKPPLPMNTVLDGPERDPLLDDEAVAVLKAVYLRQPQVPEFRARGMSDTEIVDAMHGIAQAGILKIVQRGGGIDLVPPAAGTAAAGLESPAASRVRQQQKAKRRQRRRQFRR